jgi:AraC family transcriptional regulator
MAFSLAQTTCSSTSGIPSPHAAVTSIRSLIAYGTLPPRAPAAALLVCVRVHREQWPPEAGVVRAARGIEGEVRIVDAASREANTVDPAAEWAQFLLTRDAADSLAEQHEWPASTGRADGDCPVDPVLLRLAKLALSWLERDLPAHDSALQHLHFVVCAHVLQSLSRPAPARTFPIGGLAPWQRRLALELMQTHLSEGIDLTKLAGACRLSVSHFGRCFKQTMGVSAHQYLIRLRIKAAKEKMASPDSALSEIALECGFSDQAAFSRTFGLLVGSTPGRWRRESAASSVQNGSGQSSRPLATASSSLRE